MARTKVTGKQSKSTTSSLAVAKKKSRKQPCKKWRLHKIVRDSNKYRYSLKCAERGKPRVPRGEKRWLPCDQMTKTELHRRRYCKDRKAARSG